VRRVDAATERSTADHSRRSRGSRGVRRLLAGAGAGREREGKAARWLIWPDQTGISCLARKARDCDNTGDSFSSRRAGAR